MRLLSPSPGQPPRSMRTLGGGGHVALDPEAASPDGRLPGPRCRSGEPSPMPGPPGGVRRAARRSGRRISEESTTVAPAAGLRSPSTASCSTSAESSFQLADDDRGFSFRVQRAAGPAASTPAAVARPAVLLPTSMSADLTALLRDLWRGTHVAGADRQGPSSAQRRQRRRSRPPISWPRSSSARHLRARPAPHRTRATRTFQALRHRGQPGAGGPAARPDRRASDLLRPGGRLAVLAYHLALR